LSFRVTTIALVAMLLLLAPGPVQAATISPKLDIGGYVQFRFEDAQDSTVNGFYIRRARLGIVGKPSDRVLVKLEFSGDRGADSRLTDCYVQYFLREQWTGPSVRLGQMKIPFTPEVMISDADRLCPEPAQWIVALFPDTRDKGVVLASDLTKLVSVQVGVFNGTGTAAFDNNKSKDIAGRIQFNLVPFLVVGGAVYVGDVSLPYTSETLNRHRYAADARIDLGKLCLQGEYVAARDYGTNPIGWSTQASLAAGRDTLVCRYDVYDAKDGSPVLSSVNAGLIHQIATGLTGKIFYQINSESRSSFANNVFRAEVVARF
jgi:hypothetical protein